MVLGKYEHYSSGSYTAVAQDKGATYFDLGSEWGVIQKKYNLNDRDMFEIFNVPALDDAISKGKTIQFSHDPKQYQGALMDEYNYLLKNGYYYDPKTMMAKPIK